MSLSIPHTAGHISCQSQRYFHIHLEAECELTLVTVLFTRVKSVLVEQ